MSKKQFIECTECGKGHYEEVFEPYETCAADDVKVVIPKVRLLRCPECGAELLPPETQKQIDEAIAEQTEQLTSREVECIWEKFNLDQTEAAEAIGLGSKTLHRWLKGTQYPSRSMGYYLRVLAEFPAAFEWVRTRGWRRANRIANYGKIDLQIQFPYLAEIEQPKAERPEREFNRNRIRFNPTRLFKKTKVV